MKANPGGHIDSSNVIGRDHLIALLWETLEQQSVVMTAERRIGKTSVLKKMLAQPPATMFPVFHDLEGIHSAREFASEVCKQIEPFLNSVKRGWTRVKKFFDQRGLSIAGFEIGPHEQDWKNLLTAAVEDVVSAQRDNCLVFLWDEIPFMLDNIRKAQGEPMAMEVLDLLRSLRQTHPQFRMLFTGSIGLHHVLKKLRDQQYANAPLNDMYAVEVPPLEPADGERLADLLLQGEALAAAPGAASTLSHAVGHVPFYIHLVVKELKRTRQPATLAAIEEVVSRQLVDPKDPWELAHYRDRITTYYPNDQQAVLGILDSLATASEPQSADQVLAGVRSQISFDNKNRLLELLRVMEQDHYLSRTSAGRYEIRFALIRRWWQLDRGL